MKNCIVCNSSKNTTIYNNTLIQCTDCGFVTANLELSDEKLQEIYSENYFKGEEYLDYLKDKKAIQFNFHKRLKYILKKTDRNSIDSILEIGCAYGFFAEVFTRSFPDNSYTGIDIVETAINYGRDVLKQNLVCTDYLLFQTPNYYSDVFMWDVIEHLKQPDAFLEKVHNELKDDGRIYITTGDISAFIPRFRKNKWRMIHPPTHLHYFSAKTLKKLLAKKGFEVFFINYPPVYRSIKQIFYSLFLLNKKRNSISEAIFNSIPENWQIPLNTYDIMFVGARKIKQS